MPPRNWRRAVESVQRRFGAESLDSDPIRFPRRFQDPADREAAAVIASSLAYGNIRVVCASLERIFAWTGDRPARFVRELARTDRRRSGSGPVDFRHRWTSGADVEALARIIGRGLEEHGTWGGFFSKQVVRDRRNRLDLAATIDRYADAALAFLPGTERARGVRYFFPRPRTSAVKRTAMLLRWTVRPDDGVDLGLWDCLSPAELLAPLDVHTFRIARRLGFTERRAPDFAAALDLTRWLRRLDPEDPIRYDFALSRLGIIEGCPRHRGTARCELCALLAGRVRASG